MRITSPGVADGFDIVDKRNNDASSAVEFIYKNGTLRVNGETAGAVIPDSSLVGGTSYLYQKLADKYADIATIKTIKIDSNVTSIGANAFYGTTAKKYIATSNTEIDPAAFAESGIKVRDTTNKPDTTPVNPPPTTPAGTIPGNTNPSESNFEDLGVFTNADYDGSAEFEIPYGYTSIGDFAFYNTALTSVKIPNSVSLIGTYAFMNTPLASVTIPDSVEIFTYRSFFNTKLTSVEIPNSVTMIGPGIFANTPLTSVRFSNSGTLIQEGILDHAFENTAIEEVILKNKGQLKIFQDKYEHLFPNAQFVVGTRPGKPSDDVEERCSGFQPLPEEKNHFINSNNSNQRFVGKDDVSDYFIFSGRKVFQKATTSKLDTISNFDSDHDQIIIGASKRLPGLGDISDMKYTRNITETRNALQESTPLIFEQIDTAAGALIYNQNGKVPGFGDFGGYVFKVQGDLNCFTEENLMII